MYIFIAYNKHDNNIVFIGRISNMDTGIPFIVEELYRHFVTEPNPDFWPDNLRHDPVRGHGLWAFYQGLQLGVQLTDACLEKL